MDEAELRPDPTNPNVSLETMMPKDETTLPGDTATHRLHIMQMKIADVLKFVTNLQDRRARVAEKIVKAKANKGIARAITVDKQFARLHGKIEKNLEGVESDLASIIDDLNRMRALYLEASDGAVAITKTEIEELKT